MSNDAAFTVGISAQSVAAAGDSTAGNNIIAGNGISAGVDMYAARDMTAGRNVTASAIMLTWRNFAGLPPAVDGTVCLILDASVDVSSGVLTGGGTSKAMGAAYGGQWYAVAVTAVTVAAPPNA